MRHALGLGARGLGKVWPNPAVGCVIVNNTRIVGRGWTQSGGRPHAETMALAQAGDLAVGATVYVTLEPCAHHGKTPPCADALRDAGVARVVVAVRDPDQRVNGKGIAALEQAGISVTTGVLGEEATRQHIGFIRRTVQSRPMVTLKLAASIDGRIATAAGQSQWITGPKARRVVHSLRARHDAVMVGAGTARADDPTLNTRDIGASHQPTRIIWSRLLDLPLHGKLAQSAKEIPLWIVHDKAADPQLCDLWQGLGARLFACRTGPDRLIDPVSALTSLGQAGLTRIFCEGGGALAASLISARLVDEIISFTGGISIGGDGTAMLAPFGLHRLADAPRFSLLETRPVGADTMTRWEICT